MRMHPGQADITVGIVTDLVADQFPHWGGKQVRPVASTGTVNALFRLGDDLILRFPLVPDHGLRTELIREQENARRFARHSTVKVAEPVTVADPGAGYPGPWTVYRWVDGEPANARAARSPDFARDLAGFVTAARGIDTAGAKWPGTGRGGPLSDLDMGVRSALSRSVDLAPTRRLTRVWEDCLAVPLPDRDTWIHGDLMPGNLLTRDGRLAAVIDFETANIGDPAADHIGAWNLLTSATREIYRTRLDIEDAEWHRGRGWALAQAIVALPYYVDTNRAMADNARRTLAALAA